MRKLKAIYLIPVFLLLAIGLAAGGYYMMIVPAITKTKAAHTAWDEEKKKCPEDLETKWQQALDAERADAQKLYTDQLQFAYIQRTMPPIENFAATHPVTDASPPEEQQKAIIDWYNLNTQPRVANIMRRWAAKFYTGKVPNFLPDYFSGPLLMPGEAFPDVKIVEVDLGTQVITARGYQSLIAQIKKRTGYGFFPLIIKPAGEGLTITVDRNHPRGTAKLPVLSTTIAAKAYFMTQGWDPNGDKAAVQGLLDKAKQVFAANKQPYPRRKSFDNPEDAMRKDPSFYGTLTTDQLSKLKADYTKVNGAGGWQEPPKVMYFLPGEAKDIQP
jgi:hypothetical protein